LSEKEVNQKEKILEVDNLSIDYIARGGRIRAVTSVSFELFRGETYGLVGESGCGKSTVAFGVMGYIMESGRISAGEVFFKGKSLTNKNRKDLRKIWGQKISMVFQDPDSSLNPSMRVIDQVADVLKTHQGLSANRAKSQVVTLFESLRLTDPELTAMRYPHQLSGGMKQRVCIAMALALGPDLLIMDEPTTALDVTTEATVLDLINDLKTRFNISILYITHNLGVVARVCDRVGVMYVGRLVEEANVWELFKNPIHPYTRALLNCIPKLGETKSTQRLFSIPGHVVQPKELSDGCPFSRRCAFSLPECSLSKPVMVERGHGHWSSCDCSENYPTTKEANHCQMSESQKIFSFSTCGSEEFLKINHLKHYYLHVGGAFSGGFFGRKTMIKAVDDVSFDLIKNRTLALVGESGCGKSTLARCIMGFLRPTGGSILFKGQDFTLPIEKRDRGIIHKLAIVFQNPESTLNPKHTIGYTIARPLKLVKGLEAAALREEVVRYLEAVNLSEDYAKRYPGELSGGEKQRVAIARAFAGNPEMVVCDEPTSALDVSVQASILELLLDLQNRLGTSYLFISHDLSVVHYISDYVAVMYLGKLCEIGAVGEIFEPPYHPYAEALLSAIPIADPETKQKTLRLVGSVPSLVNPPTGCRFHTRCHRKLGKICEKDEPPELKISEGKRIYCHIPINDLKKVEPIFSR
jgi:peptide/nickel transport system ATP-binding protein